MTTVGLPDTSTNTTSELVFGSLRAYGLPWALTARYWKSIRPEGFDGRAIVTCNYDPDSGPIPVRLCDSGSLQARILYLFCRRVHRLQRPVAPVGHLGDNLVGDPGNGVFADRGAVDIGEVRGDLKSPMLGNDAWLLA